MGPRQSCDAKRASRTARDASRHLVALVGLLCHRAVHDYALYAMLAVGSEAPHATRAHVCAALVGRVRVCRPPQRGRRKGTWRARARQDAFFKVPLERDQLTRRVALPPLGRLARGLGQSKIRHSGWWALTVSWGVAEVSWDVVRVSRRCHGVSRRCHGVSTKCQQDINSDQRVSRCVAS